MEGRIKLLFEEIKMELWNDVSKEGLLEKNITLTLQGTVHLGLRDTGRVPGGCLSLSLVVHPTTYEALYLNTKPRLVSDNSRKR